MPKLILATHNEHKAKEIIDIFAKFNIVTDKIATTKYDEPIENGTTFEENAFIKAKFAYEKSGGVPALADDSGIIVDILENAPGVFSARWGGTNATPADNVFLLLDQLKDVRKKNRKAKFVTASILYINHKKIIVKFGEIDGVLTTKPIGNNGFGYDPILIPKGYKKTIAQMDKNEKNNISHRRKAIEKIIPYIKKIL